MKKQNYLRHFELFILTILPPTVIIIYELQKYVIPIIIGNTYREKENSSL